MTNKNRNSISISLVYTLLIICSVLISSSQGAMVDNGDGTITDTDSGLMWLKNANNGQADWAGAIQWANNLNFAQHSDWRIPSGVNSSDGQICNSQPAGLNCTETEFGSLYFGYGIANLFNSGVFQNVQWGVYWTSTEFPSDTSKAMTQDFVDGGQNPFDKTLQLNLWAVRDVGPIPPPALIENADGTVTDTVQCLTWTKDANLPCTQNYGAGNWQGGCWFYSLNSAEEWANQLDFAGHQDWRLSSEVMIPNTSELEVLFYDILGNSPGGPITNTGPFTNVLQSTPFTYYDGNANRVTVQRVHSRYWISDGPVNPGREPSFDINDQTYGDHFMTDGESFSAWAVRDGCDIIPKICNDGIDNDNDGLIDTDDPGCDSADDNDESGGLLDNGDTVTDFDVCLMWAKNANLAGNHLDFDAANTFAQNATLAGFSDWRLPDAHNFDGTGPCVTVGGVGGVCRESELGHLYYTELGNSEGGPLSNTGPFINMTQDFYWTGTESSPGWAYEFGFLDGSQNNTSQSNQNRVLIVRDLADPAIGCPISRRASQCSDGIDNDGDGLIDYPDDGDCCNANDQLEGARHLRSDFTRTIAYLAHNKVKYQFEKKPALAAILQANFLDYLMCPRFVPSFKEEFEHIPICFDGPITTGAPRECPPLDCLIDGPGCMEPYGFRRVIFQDEPLHVFAQLVEGQLSNKDFDERIKTMIAEGQITFDTNIPSKKRYLPKMSLTIGILLGGVVIVLVAFTYVSARRKPD